MTQEELDVLQDFFDHAWEAFVVDRLPQSTDGKGDCLYRHPWIRNHGCAIGCRDGYNDQKEGKAAREVVLGESFYVDASPLGTALDDLQDVHDVYLTIGHSRNDRAALFEQFADRYGLEVG